MRNGFAFMLALLAASSAESSVILVPADYSTLLAGVDAAVAGDTVLVSAGTWTDTETRGTDTACAFMPGGVSLIAKDGPSVTSIDLTGSPVGTSGVLVVDQADSVLVEGFTFTGRMLGVSGTCLVGARSRGVTVRRCSFVGNESADVVAPAIWIRECRLTIEDSEFVGNRSDLGLAGVVNVIDSTFFFRNSVFRNNVGSIGIQVSILDVPAPRPHIIEDSEFVDNKMVGGAPLVLFGFPFDVRRCLFLRNTTTSLGGAILVAGKDVTIEFNTFAYDSAGSGSTSASGGAIQPEGLGPFVIRGNTFLGCHSDVRGGAVAANGANVHLENNVFAYSTGGTALGFVNGATLQSSTCNVFWMNQGGDIEGEELGPSDVTAAPQFCDLPALDLTLHSTSPCAAPNSDGCGLIGAWDVGCGPLSVRSESWGAIKSLYR